MIFDGEEGEKIFQFGSGDIGVAPGFVPGLDSVVGSVSFYPQQARPINEALPEWDNCVKDTDLSEIPLRFVFTDPRSIDVVIWGLQEAKKFMTGESPIPDCSENASA